MTQTVDFFRARLDVMIDLRHPLAVLATRLPWSQIEAELAPIWRRNVREGIVPDGEDLFGSGGGVLAAAGVSYAGRSRLPIRLMCSLLYLKHAFNLSDEETCERWGENVVWQYFSGLDYYEPRLPCDATQIGRFRAAIGEAGLQAILKATIDTAVASKAIKPTEFERIIVDSTVQEKAIAYPVDSRLLEIARYKIVVHAKRCGISLRQSFAKEGKALKRKAGGYAHAKQFKRLHRTVKRQRTIVGKLIREVRSRLSMGAFNAAAAPTTLVALSILLERADGVA
jgi:transposase, IS5 family